ncbi:MAG: anion permease [Acidobacteria bacterium]|nr:anion permease [Acidobacteriota bacterium]
MKHAALIGTYLHCSPIELSRAVPNLSEEAVRAGTRIFSEGGDARCLMILLEGTVRISKGSGTRDVTVGFLGEEAGLGFADYHADASAVSDVSLLVIPRETVTRLCADKPELHVDLSASLVRRFEPRAAAPAPETAREEEKRGASARTLAGWLATSALSALAWFMGPLMGLDKNAVLFLAVFTATMALWMFNLADEYIPGLFAIVMLLVMDVAPPSVVLSGFGSDEFFMVLSVSAIGAVLEVSGLTYRIALRVLKAIPASQFWQNAAVVVLGIAITPVIPSANGRISIGMPLYRDILDIQGYAPRGRASTYLAASLFSGLTLFSGLFLTSKTIHLVVNGMLPRQVADQFGWLHWTVAAAVYGLVLLVVSLAAAHLYFRNREVPRAPKAQLRTQLEVLGPLKAKEIAAIAGIALMVLGFMTTGLHSISPPWIALAMLYVFLSLQVLNKREFQQKINWVFLIYLGSLTGLSKTMSFLGLDHWFGTRLGFIVRFMQSDFALFVLFLGLAITAVRFFVPNNATVAVFATFLLPMAGIAGVNPWIVAFIILSLSDAWIFPYQCTYYLEFREVNDRQKRYDERAFLWYNLGANLFRLVAIYASLIYWRWLGIL